MLAFPTRSRATMDAILVEYESTEATGFPGFVNAGHGLNPANPTSYATLTTLRSG
jgi:hypothetical protein